MICVPVGNCVMRSVLKNIRIAAKSADLVEIRADSIRNFSLPVLLKEKISKPLIFTCLRQAQRLPAPQQAGGRQACYARSNGGAFKGTESQRISHLLSAIISGRFEYITVDVTNPFAIPLSTRLLLALARQAGAKTILAWHNYRNTPDNLSAIYKRLAALKPDAVKIVTYARYFSDNFRIFGLALRSCPLERERPHSKYQSGAQKAARRKGPKLIAFCMGEKGLISRILYRKFGLFLTYASYKQGAETAEGQIQFEQMKYLYRADSINRRTKIFGLLGNPIEHSYSPVLFNALFNANDINGVYLPFAAEPKRFSRDFRMIKSFLKPQGFSITSPYKITAMRFAGRLSKSAREIGAINTIYLKANRFIGTNTDWFGVLETLYHLRKYLNQRPAPPAPTRRRRGKKGEVCPEGRQALVLGKGGAAKAIAYTLRNSGIKTMVFARKSGKGVLPLSRIVSYCRGPGDNKMIINATPIGMPPDINKSPIPKSCLKKGMIVFDTIYNPSETRLLKDARSKRCITINGLRMFLVQAMKQVECFTHAFRNSKR